MADREMQIRYIISGRELQIAHLQGAPPEDLNYIELGTIYVVGDIHCSSDRQRRMGGRKLPQKPKYGYERAADRPLYI